MNPRILVVDDDWAMQELFKSILELAGFEILLASDENEFRAMALGEKIDAIILDIMLGNQDGPKIYEELIRKGLDPGIPVIFVSGLAKDLPPVYPQKDRRFALLGKPFDSQKLVQELQKVI